jgi:pyruvate-formate lyase-activating enzyme
LEFDACLYSRAFCIDLFGGASSLGLMEAIQPERALKEAFMRAVLSGLFLSFLATQVLAGEADVVKADVTPQADGSYRFDVTVRHGDEGWDHYADAWEVLSEDGKVLAVRVLAHPHVNEQPFTRSLSGVEIPAGMSRVVVRAKDSVHGYGGETVTVKVPGR